MVTTPASFACIPALTLCTSATGTSRTATTTTARTMLLTSGLLDGFLAESGSHPGMLNAHSQPCKAVFGNRSHHGKILLEAQPLGIQAVGEAPYPAIDGLH